jgi:tetratricopeptide (TPR) repeat protein
VSLLLEALKKAEKAKEEAQRRAREGGDAAEAPPPEPERKSVVTRDKLPDIASTPLDIARDELSPPPAPPVAPQPRPVVLELEPEAPPPSRAAAKPAPKPAARPASAKAPDADAAGRANAKKVFEAKFREPNPRMPFYITVGVLGVFAVGTVIYFWYQLRPPPTLVNLNPAPQAQTAQAAQAQPERAPVVAAPASTAQNSIPGLPPVPPKSAAAPAPAAPATPAVPAVKPPAAKAPAEAQPVETPRLTPRLQPARPAPAPAEAPTVSRLPPQVNPRVDAGYSAYMAGDLTAARSDYEQALRDEPANRDALLGLAALDVRAGRYEAAEALYLRMLAADPRDPQAQAALIALRAGRSDPLATESRVKSMLATAPQAHVLNFTLGNQLAQQNRWAEAQQEYFKAYSAEPDNADFAFNLAVSLDHLRQSRPALEYYQRAIALGEKRGASFNLDAARERAAQLSR